MSFAKAATEKEVEVDSMKLRKTIKNVKTAEESLVGTNFPSVLLIGHMHLTVRIFFSQQ